MKKRIIMLAGCVIMIIAFLPLFSLAQTEAKDCNPLVLQKSFEKLDDLYHWTKDSVNGYYLLDLTRTADKKLYITYKGEKRTWVDYDQSSDYSILRIGGEFLEIVVLGKVKMSYFYLGGKELRAFVPNLLSKYFRIRTDGKKLYICYKDNEDTVIGYGVLDLRTNSYCSVKIPVNPTKNP